MYLQWLCIFSGYVSSMVMYRQWLCIFSGYVSSMVMHLQWLCIFSGSVYSVISSFSGLHLQLIQTVGGHWPVLKLVFAIVG